MPALVTLRVRRDRLTETVVEQDRMRSSIRAFAARSGMRLKGAAPTGMVAALVAVACMPAVSALLVLAMADYSAADLAGVAHSRSAQRQHDREMRRGRRADWPVRANRQPAVQPRQDRAAASCRIPSARRARQQTCPPPTFAESDTADRQASPCSCRVAIITLPSGWDDADSVGGDVSVAGQDRESLQTSLRH